MPGVRAGVRAGCALGLLLLAIGVPSVPAHAHADLVSSDPAAGDRVEETPRQVVLEFDEPMRLVSGGLVVEAPGGDQHPLDVLGSDEGDVHVAVLGTGGRQGRWTVRYEAVSSDGHVASGRVRFWVGASTVIAGAERGTASLSRPAAVLLVLLSAGFAVLLRITRQSVAAP